MAGEFAVRIMILIVSMVSIMGLLFYLWLKVIGKKKRGGR